MGDEIAGVWAYKLGGKAEPRAIDFEGVEGPEKGNKQPGIYTIKGDELTLCVSHDGKGRPDGLRTEAGKDWVLQKLKRVK